VELSADWVVGFVDGQGEFLIHLTRHHPAPTGFQVQPELVFVRPAHDAQVLYALKQFFRGGVVRRTPDNQMSLRVRNLSALEGVCEFLMSHPLKTRKNVDFRKFRRIVRLLCDEHPLTRDGLRDVLQITAKMTTCDRRRLEEVRRELLQHG
jgi:hypothetical protein